MKFLLGLRFFIVHSFIVLEQHEQQHSWLQLDEVVCTRLSCHPYSILLRKDTEEFVSSSLIRSLLRQSKSDDLRRLGVNLREMEILGEIFSYPVGTFSFSEYRLPQFVLNLLKK